MAGAPASLPPTTQLAKTKAKKSLSPPCTFKIHDRVNMLWPNANEAAPRVSLQAKPLLCTANEPFTLSLARCSTCVFFTLTKTSLLKLSPSQIRSSKVSRPDKCYFVRVLKKQLKGLRSAPIAHKCIYLYQIASHTEICPGFYMQSLQLYKMKFPTAAKFYTFLLFSARAAGVCVIFLPAL